MPSSLRRSAALASALAVGSTALIAGAPAANASLSGSGEVLTISNKSTSIKFIGDASRTVLNNPFGETMANASWSPDGSRAAYIDPDGGITSIRFDGKGDLWYVAPPEDGVTRTSPSYRGDGGSLVWGEKAGSSGKWVVRVAPSSSGAYGGQLSPEDGQHYLNPDGGPNSTVVFQRQADNGSGLPTGTPAVILYDYSRPEAERVTLVDDNGANPSISPQGDRIAFVRNGQIIVSDLTGEGEVAVTSNAAAHDNPTWSPDGKKIAFSQGTQVATAAADGTTAANPTVVSTTAGVPAYQPRRKDRAVRLSGASRFGTAAAVSQSHWKSVTDQSDTREQAGAVVLSRSDTFADALSGSALAAAKRGPLLLTPSTSLEASTKAELQRVLAPGGVVYLLGSAGALSTSVENEVKGLGYTVRRLAGADRFGTSVEISKAIDPTPDLVLLATGMNFPDALAAGAAAGSFDAPGSGTSAVVVLTNDSALPTATKSFLDSLSNTDRVIFGIGRGAAAAAEAYDPSGIPLFGAGRYETALLTSYVFFGGSSHIGLATGTNWPDALAGGALMGLLNGPLMLTPGTSGTLGVEAQWLLDENSASVNTALIFGSTAVVSYSQQTQAGTWIGGPLGFSRVDNPTNVRIAAGARSTAGLRTTGGAGVRTPEQAVAAAKALTERKTRR
ncbi:cell wall-binding repeat-containing protein [Micromonospora sp. NPDC049275]|uniref:cell wall-binding repeat-containing protein n=1 Tax=Micromonospora sp. NPDC049275 TaxID=3364268 RepID=UPI00371DF64B